jgi:hypothetical protein
MTRWQEIIKRLAGKTNVRGAEIGVERGKLARHMLAQPNVIEYLCVDRWRYNESYAKTAHHKDTSNVYHEKNFKQFLKMVSEYPDKIRIISMSSRQAVKIIPNDYFDWVFIDANHDGNHVAEDIRNWRQKVKHGGFICGHEWGHKGFPESEPAVREAFYYDTPDTYIHRHKWPITLGGDWTWFAQRP